jgi:hypothetical protein
MPTAKSNRIESATKLSGTARERAPDEGRRIYLSGPHLDPIALAA